jgi:hypothetical protein
MGLIDFASGSASVAADGLNAVAKLTVCLWLSVPRSGANGISNLFIWNMMSKDITSSNHL